MFKEYREAYDAMEADETIQWYREAIKEYQATLDKFEKPYRERMAEAEEKIVAAVLPGKQSVTLFGVAGRFFKGRRSTSWKGVAMELEPPQELIEAHSKVGEPRVVVGIVEDWEGDTNADS